MKTTQQVALVSGASRGIGAATARELGQRGYCVIVNYHINVSAAEAVVKSIESAGGAAEAVQADVCDSQQVARLVDHVHDVHGRVDVLVCNANTADPPMQPLSTLPWEALAGKVTSELAAAFFLTQRCAAIMRQQRAGRIVYVSSIAADQISGSIPHSVAKAALNTFARHVAGDAARYGVTVNVVAPGPVRTDATAALMSDGVDEFFATRSILGRILEPDDIGRVIGQVADEGFAATSQVIRVDAGFEVLGTPGLEDMVAIMSAQAPE